MDYAISCILLKLCNADDTQEQQHIFEQHQNMTDDGPLWLSNQFDSNSVPVGRLPLSESGLQAQDGTQTSKIRQKLRQTYLSSVK